MSLIGFLRQIGLLLLPAYKLKPNAFFDFSHWETVDFNRLVLPEGTRGLITKATQGKGYLDPTFPYYFDMIGKLPVFRGAYHYFEPNDVMGQVINFCTNVIDAGWRDGDIAILDAEYIPPPWKKGEVGVVRGADYAYQVWFWLTEVEKRLGTRPVLYWSKNVSLQMLDKDGKPPAWVNEYWNWVAWYPDGAYIDSNEWLPNDLLPVGVRPDRVAGWQYAANWVLEGVNYDGVDVNTASDAWLETLAPAVPQPEEQPVEVPMTFGILRHRAEWDPHWLDDNGSAFLPETVQLQDAPKGDNKGASIPVTPAMWDYIDRINNADGQRYARSVGMMWINTPYQDGDTPKAESIMTAHNFIAFDAETSTHLRLQSLTSDMALAGLDPAIDNWYTLPWLFWKAITSRIDSAHANVASGFDVFLPLMARARSHNGTGELWVPKSRVEVFPALPVVVTIAVPNLNIRSGPSTMATVIGSYPQGTQVTVTEYAPRGASVWGKTDKGWICLLGHFSKNAFRAFYTSWRLASLGVIPPSPYAEPLPAPEPPPPPAFQRYAKRIQVTWVIDENGTEEVETLP